MGLCALEDRVRERRTLGGERLSGVADQGELSRELPSGAVFISINLYKFTSGSGGVTTDMATIGAASLTKHQI